MKGVLTTKMAKEKSVIKRVNPKFHKEMKDTMDTRVKLGLMEIDDAKMPKMTELLTRTDGFKISIKELKTKREKTNG